MPFPILHVQLGLLVLNLAFLFAMVFLLYRSLQILSKKVNQVEETLGLTAQRVLDIKEKTNGVTYRKALARIKKGEDLVQVAQDLGLPQEEVAALAKVLGRDELFS